MFSVDAVVLLAAIGWASAAPAQSIGGRYQVTGTNFNGSPYSGTAEIFTTSDTTCRMTWQTGGTSARGICMRNATTFVAAYSMRRGYGLVIYDIKPDGSMEGTWTVADQNGIGTERLIPLR
jgi:hypothetical protein